MNAGPKPDLVIAAASPSPVHLDSRELFRSGNEVVIVHKGEEYRLRIAAGVPMGVVLADAGYGDETAFRDGITALGMRYAVGIRPTKLRREPGSEKLVAGHPYEGRGWRGFHHHGTLSIAAYGFLMAQRLKAGSNAGGKKTSPNAKCLPFPKITCLRAARRA